MCSYYVFILCAAVFLQAHFSTAVTGEKDEKLRKFAQVLQKDIAALKDLRDSLEEGDKPIVQSNDDGDDEVEESSASTTMLKDFIRKTIRDKLQKPDVSKDYKAEDGRRSYLQDNKAKIRKFLREDFRAQEGVNDLQHKRHYIQQNSKRLKNLLQKDFEAYMEKTEDRKTEYIAHQDEEVPKPKSVKDLEAEIRKNVYYVLHKEDGVPKDKIEDYGKNRAEDIIGIVRKKFRAYLKTNFESLKAKLTADFVVKEGIRTILTTEGNTRAEVNNYLKAEIGNILKFLEENGYFDVFESTFKYFGRLSEKLIADFESNEKKIPELKKFLRAALIQAGETPADINKYLDSELANIVGFLAEEGAFENVVQGQQHPYKQKLIDDFQLFIKVDKVGAKISSILTANGKAQSDINKYLNAKIENIFDYLKEEGYLTEALKQGAVSKPLKEKLLADFQRYIDEEKIKAKIAPVLIAAGKKRPDINSYLNVEVPNVYSYLEEEGYLKEALAQGAISKPLKEKLLGDFEKFMTKVKKVDTVIIEILSADQVDSSAIKNYLRDESGNIIGWLNKIDVFEHVLEIDPKGKTISDFKDKLIADFKRYCYKVAVTMGVESMLTAAGYKLPAIKIYLKAEMVNIIAFLKEQGIFKQILKAGPMFNLARNKLIADFQKFKNEGGKGKSAEYKPTDIAELDFLKGLWEEAKNAIRESLKSDGELWKSFKAFGYKFTDKTVNAYLNDELRGIIGFLGEGFTSYIDKNPELMKTELIADFKRYNSLPSKEDLETKDARALDREVNRKKDEPITHLKVEEKDDATADVEEKEVAASGAAKKEDAAILVESNEKEVNSAAKEEPVAKDVPTVKDLTNGNDAASSMIESDHYPSLSNEAAMVQDVQKDTGSAAKLIAATKDEVPEIHPSSDDIELQRARESAMIRYAKEKREQQKKRDELADQRKMSRISSPRMTQEDLKQRISDLRALARKIPALRDAERRLSSLTQKLETLNDYDQKPIMPLVQTFVGVWSTDWPGLKQKSVYEITADGKFTAKYCNWGCATDGPFSYSYIALSDNEESFPSSKGWRLVKEIHESTTWVYIRLTAEGKLKIVWFCETCKETYNGAHNFHANGVGLATRVQMDDEDDNSDDSVAEKRPVRPDNDEDEDEGMRDVIDDHDDYTPYDLITGKKSVRSYENLLQDEKEIGEPEVGI